MHALNENKLLKGKEKKRQMCLDDQFVFSLLWFHDSSPPSIKESIPFAVIGSNTVVEAKGKRVRGRLYPWGIVEGRSASSSSSSFQNAWQVSFETDLHAVVLQWRTRRTATSWNWGTCSSARTCKTWRMWPARLTTRTTGPTASRAWPAWWWRSATASTIPLQQYSRHKC